MALKDTINKLTNKLTESKDIITLINTILIFIHHYKEICFLMVGEIIIYE